MERFILFIVCFSAWIAVAKANSQSVDLDTFLRAIDGVESNHNDNVPDGDNGLAIGRFQIHYDYWKDAVSFDKSLGGSYQDCRKYEYARKVVIAYLKRYGADAITSGDYKKLARIHNGGPKGHKKKSTLKYWERVSKRLTHDSVLN